MRSISLAFLLIFVLFSCVSKKEKEDQPGSKTPSDSIPATKKEPGFTTLVPVDISPMDMSYWPTDYPKLKMASPAIEPPIGRIIYSRPHLQGRHIFHEVLKYGEPWRLGANESTELDLYSSIKIQDKKIVPGRYIIFCIPQKDHWTIVFNNNIDSWGLEEDRTKDLFSFDIPVTTTPNSIEYFTIVFETTTKGANLLMTWDNIEARLPMEIL